MIYMDNYHTIRMQQKEILVDNVQGHDKKYTCELMNNGEIG